MRNGEGRHGYSALAVWVSLKSPARLSASSSDMSTEAPSRLRFRRPERPEEKLLMGPPRLLKTTQVEHGMKNTSRKPTC